MKTLKDFFNEHPEWNKKILMAMTVEEFFQLADCPFCSLVYMGYMSKPDTKDCNACFGHSRVPIVLIDEIKSTQDYISEKFSSTSGDIRD